MTQAMATAFMCSTEKPVHPPISAVKSPLLRRQALKTEKSYYSQTIKTRQTISRYFPAAVQNLSYLLRTRKEI